MRSGVCDRSDDDVCWQIYCLTLSTVLDKYFALAYFMRGNCYHERDDYLQALLDYTATLEVCILLARSLLIVNPAVAR